MTPYGKIQAKIREDIARVGWSSIGVFGEDADNPSFTYTIGLCLRGRPELLMVGLRSDRSHAFFSQYIDAMEEHGPFEDRHVSTDFAAGGFRLAFCDLDPKRACEEYMFQAENYLGGHPPPSVQQLVWADKRNILPFEPGCDERMARMQSRVRDYRAEVVAS